jgi:hypothetical protein
MTILGKDFLRSHGPYVEFFVLETPLPVDDEGQIQCLPPETGEPGLFFEFADDLLSCYCSITRSFSPFDPYEIVQFTRPAQIYAFTAELLRWEVQLVKTPHFYFTRELVLYNETDLQPNEVNHEKMRADLLETLHFIVGRLHRAAASGQCVVIVGF